MASFAEPADMAIYYDIRRIQQLLSDTGTPVTDTENNATLLALLARGTEEILAHCQRGKRYTELELQTLADSETSGFYLVSLCCDLAFGYLVQRRGTGAADVDRQAPNFKLALVKLQQLADGFEIFPRLDNDEHPDAGTPETTDLTRLSNNTCSYVNTGFRRLLPSRRFGRFGGQCGGTGSC